MNIKNKLRYVVATLFFFVTIVSFVVLIFSFNEYRKTPDITKESLLDYLNSKIYDKDDNVIAILGSERREFVESSDIPDTVKDAVLSVEDTRFYSHIGVDPKRIVKAMLVNLYSGESREGGSTVTQQVVKTSLLTSQKSYVRKIQEAFLSLELESKYSKDDIIGMYLNKIFYSDNQYGIKSAAKYFYNKELSELTIPEVALLAGMPQQPMVYNPYDNPEASKDRRNTVLYMMYSNDKITKAEYEEYINVPIENGLVARDREDRILQSVTNPKYAAYVDLVVKEIKNSGVFEEGVDPFSLGLQIHTNMDPDAQEYIQTMLDEQSYPMIKHDSQAAVTILDTKSGGVSAVAGGKNYTYGDFNFSIDSRLQSGSAIKPILDYAPGIEYYNWDSAITFEDTLYKIAGTELYIQNWDRMYRGNVTMRRALAMSYNVPAVKAFESVGYERSKHFANKLGIELTTQEPTVAIGGHVDVVSPMSLAAAYASFGNGGMYNKPTAITSVRDREGNEVSGFKTESTRAMNESTAFLVTDILKDVLTVNGTAPYAAVTGYELAAKTGSTTFDSDTAKKYNLDVANAIKDSWIVGYSTKYTVAIWQGVDSMDSQSKALNSNNEYVTQLMFGNIMKFMHGNTIPDKFVAPSTVALKGGVYYAKDRNTETDDMYAGTAMDAVYQAKVTERSRDSRALLSTALIEKITSNQNSTTTNRNNTTTTTNTGR